MKNILRNILAVLDKKEKKQFGILIVLDILISIIEILSLALLLWIIRFYIQPVHANLSFLPGWLADANSVMFIAVFVIIFGIKNLAGYFISRSQFKFISSIAIRVSQSNLIKYQQARFNEFVNVDSSVHIRNIAFQPFNTILRKLAFYEL